MGEVMWPPAGLSRRELEILDITYRRHPVTAAEIRSEMRDPPVDGAVRTLLRRLEQKGHLRHRQVGARYLYEPKVPRPRAQKAALKWLAKTFFGGSVVKAAAAVLDEAAVEMSDEDLAEFQELVNRRRDRDS